MLFFNLGRHAAGRRPLSFMNSNPRAGRHAECRVWPVGRLSGVAHWPRPACDVTVEGLPNCKIVRWLLDSLSIMREADRGRGGVSLWRSAFPGAWLRLSQGYAALDIPWSSGGLSVATALLTCFDEKRRSEDQAAAGPCALCTCASQSPGANPRAPIISRATSQDGHFNCHMRPRRQPFKILQSLIRAERR